MQAPVATGQERIAKARFAVLGTKVYPDATFTLRMSYGDVRGWPEKGQQVEPFTKLSRLYERTTGQDPFRLPQRWLDARSKLDPNTPFDYVTTHDIVGGNSGSPVVDAQGRLVGLAFDGNIHSIAGSYWYDERMNRAVAVHPAIIVTALRDVYGAKASRRSSSVSGTDQASVAYRFSATTLNLMCSLSCTSNAPSATLNGLIPNSVCRTSNSPLAVSFAPADFDLHRHFDVAARLLDRDVRRHLRRASVPPTFAERSFTSG